MPIVVECQCGRKLRAKEELAGRWVRCPNCQQGVLVPLPEVEEEERGEIALADDAPVRPPPAPAPPPRWRPPNFAAHEAPPPEATPPPKQLRAAEKSWRGHVYWLLLLALIPLSLNVLVARETPQDRFERTLKHHPELRDRLASANRDDDEEEDAPVTTTAPTAPRHEVTMRDVERLLPHVPGNRLEGALLPRTTWMHWLYALIAAGIFLAIVSFALPEFPARPLHLLWAGLFTGTAGVVLLLTIQVVGMFCVCCIGAMYIAALDPRAPFGASLIGFFFGVGFLEEFVKALPVLWLLYRYENVGWREACLWGMASGAGFGISEGIHYCSNYYNGIETAEMYFVRFASCVAFHTLLSGACAILLQKKQHLLNEGKDYFDWTLNFMAIVTVPILLHGLFDTLAKKDHDILALGIALLSFAWLTWLIHNARDRETPKPPPGGFVVLERTEKGTRFVAPQ